MVFLEQPEIHKSSKLPLARDVSNKGFKLTKSTRAYYYRICNISKYI